MKVIKKAVKAAAKATKAVRSIVGTFVAIGSRGVVVSELDKIEPPLVLGRQPILPKSRDDGAHFQMLWVKSCSWITSRKEVDSKTGQPMFTLLGVESAKRQGLVKIHKNMKFRAGGKVHTGDIVSLPDWDPAKKQPQYLGVLNCKTYKHRRIENKAIRLADKTVLNEQFLGKLLPAKK